MPERVMEIDGVRYVLVPEHEFTALMRQVVMTVRLAAALAGQFTPADGFVTPEFRRAVAEGFRKLANPRRSNDR